MLRKKKNQKIQRTFSKTKICKTAFDTDNQDISKKGN